MITLQRDQAYIAELASRHLTIEEEEVVQEYLLDNQTIDARRCLLGKIDLLWEDQKMKDHEIIRIYETLGVTPKDCFLNAKL